MSEEEKKAIEHNSFNTAIGNGEYKITFETNNKNNYLFIQELARLFIDRNYKPKEFERLKLNNENLEKEIEKKDKIIDLMTDKLSNGIIRFKNKDKRSIIEYFTKKVED